MASKKLLGLEAGITGTIGTADIGTMTGALTVTGAVTASANLTANTATVSNDLTVGGDLNVTGDIVSGGTTNTVTTDDFIDLANGNVNSSVLSPGGFTVQTAAATGFTAVNCDSFDASAVGLVKNQKTLNVVTLPLTGEFITMTNLNQEYRVNFLDSGVTSGVFNSAGVATVNISVGNNDSTTLVAVAMTAQFQALGQYTCTISGDTCPIINGSNSKQLVLTFADGTLGSKITVTDVGTVVSDGQAPFVTLASNAAAAGFASNQLLSITAADDAGNVGLFVISSVLGDNVYIKGNESVDLKAETPFAQNQFQTDATVGGTAVQPRIFVNTVSNGSTFKDSGGSALTLGVPIYAYSDAGTEAQFTALGAYKITGSDAASSGTTLQIAYDAGQTITMAAGDVTWTVDTDNDFIIDGAGAGAGQVLFGTTTDIDVFTVNTDDALTLLGGEDGTAANDGISITSSRINDVADAGLASQAAAMHIESAGGISVEAAKNVAIMGDEVATIARFTSFAPIGANGAISLVKANGTASAGTLVVDAVPVTASTLGITSTDILATVSPSVAAQTITFDNTVVVGSSATVFASDAAIVGVSGPPTEAQVAQAIAVLMNSIGSPSSPDLRATVSTDTVTIHSAKYNGISGNITWTSNANITDSVVNSTNVAALFAQEAFNDGRTVGEAFAPNVVGVNAASVEIALGTSSGYTIGGIVEIMAGAAVSANEVGLPVYLATGVPDASGLSSAGMITPDAPTDTGTTIFKVGIAMASATQGTKGKVLLQPQFIAYNAG